MAFGGAGTLMSALPEQSRVLEMFHEGVLGSLWGAGVDFGGSQPGHKMCPQFRAAEKGQWDTGGGDSSGPATFSFFPKKTGDSLD